MKVCSLVAGIFAVSILSVFAQPATVTVTNFATVTITNYVTVTVTVTNMVTITNIPPAPAASSAVTPAVAAIAAGVPPAPAIKPRIPWQNQLSMGLTMTRGNSDSTVFTAEFQTQRKTPFDEYKIDLKGAYGSQDGVQNVNNYGGTVQWNHLFTERFYGYTRADALRDIIAAVNYRVTVGPGVGYFFMKTTNTTLAAEVGGAFVAQQLGNSQTITNGMGNVVHVESLVGQTFASMRFAERFEHRINDHVRIWQNAEILPQVDKFDNYTVNLEIGVETALSKSFSLKTFLDDTYNSIPAEGKLKNDARIVAALGYKF